MKKVLGTIENLLFVVICLGLTAYIVAVASGYRPDFFGYRVLRVLSSSMVPQISENTCIIIKETPVEEIRIGDIITFESDDPAIKGYLNTHRVYDIENEDGQTVYITKGDANSLVDLYPVKYEQVYGKFIRELPFGENIGSMIAALADQKLYFVVIILPLMLCFISYLWKIFRILTDDEDNEDDEADKIKDKKKDKLI